MSDINVQTFQGKVNISNNLKVGSGHLFVDTLNNQVGLNTNTPLANLHVNGNTYVNTDLRVGSKLLIDSGASDSNVLVVTGGNIKADYLHGDGSNIQNITSSQWTTVNTNELYYDVGNVGIGNQNPSTTLDVTGTSSFSDDLTVGTDKLFVDVSAGRVGVGTVAPGYTLDIAGDINFTGNLTQNGSAYGGSGGSGGGVWQAGTGTKIYYSAGNVGVANTDPDHTLSVGSNLYVDDAGSNVLVVDGNVAANQITLGQFEIVPSYGLDDVVNESNTTTNTVHLSNVTTGVITTSNALIGGELTVTGNMVTSSNITVTGNVVVDDNLYLTSNAKLLVNSNTVVEHAGPHGRLPKTVPLKKYPEILFEEGKFDSNDSTNTYVQAGYTVTASSILDSTRQPWEAFNGLYGDDVDGWFSQSGYGGADNAYSGSANLGSDSGGPAFANEDKGEWLKLEMPHKLTMTHIKIYASGSTRTVHAPEDFKIWGSNNNTNWTEILSETGAAPTVTGSTYNADTTTTAYKYFALVTTKLVNNNSHCDIGELEIYGYEEDPPAGDTSVDTTFTSIMNTPQTTGANVYVDGNLGETFTNRVTGPTPTGTATTYNETGKYWELTGALTSNVTLEANTFLEGDQPHAVSVWFNSSNLEANVSNTCVFSISDQEKLDSVNLDLQSNTWHNLTYAYQGEGGSRVTYLDGRKVAEDQAEDTFGNYPPFAMTGYSQGGYVVSASSEASSTQNAWKAFDNNTNPNDPYRWVSASGTYNTDGSYGGTESHTDVDGNVEQGEWLKIEVPHKLKVSYFEIAPYPTNGSQSWRNYAILGSNDDTNWYQVQKVSGLAAGNGLTAGSVVPTGTYKNSAFKYFVFIWGNKAADSNREVAMGELKLYGHRENDLVRLPDPTNVLKYPHVIFPNYDGPAGQAPNGTPSIRGYVATTDDANNSYPIGKAFDGIFSDPAGGNTNNQARWQPATVIYANNGTDTTSGATTTLTNGTTYKGNYMQLESPHKLNVTKYKIYSGTYLADYRPSKVVMLGSNTGGSDWVDLGSGETTLTYSGTNADYAATVSISNTSTYKYHRLVIRAIAAQTLPVVYQLELYGTGVDSIPIQIGGGNIDKVANFRVYDKFVGEDQALEIWDAQKDAFGRAKSSMTLQKGRLGIGTTEPEGRLAVVDEPHAPEVFPPGNMVADETYFEGHGKFKARGIVINNNVDYPPWEGFNDISEPQTLYYTGSSGGATGDGGFNNSDATYSGTLQLSSETVLGPWLILELPYKVYVSKIEYYPQLSGAGGENLTHQVAEATIYGRNGNGIWKEIATMSTAPIIPNYLHHTFNTLDSSIAYNQLAFIATKRAGQSSAGITVRNLKFFGTREQGQSVLHDGQLTLTKNLNVPRIGPALDADDTPRRDRLVVEYNTSTNPTFEGAVWDTSGRGLDAILRDATYDATDKSIRVGTSQDIFLAQGIPGKSGDVTNVSYSIWFNADNVTDANQIIMSQISAYAVGVGLTLALNTNELQLGFGYAYSSGQQIGGAVLNAISAGQWYHVVAIKKGSGTLNATTLPDILEIYINGEKKTLSHGGGTGTLNVGTDHWLIIGSIQDTHSTTEEFKGNVSSIKYYDTVLTASEVKTLYDMGRCDEGHHVVNFSKTRVGIGLGDGEAPRAALDVRGDIYGGCPVLFDCVAQLTTNVGSYVDWNLVKLNKGGGLSGTTFTAPVAGHYFFHVHGMGAWTFNASEVRFVLEWHKNGVHYGITQDYDAQMYDGRDCVDADGFHMKLSGSIIAYLEIGETIQVIVDSTSNTTLHGRYNRFTGHYIG
jgi:hypothetical protein